MTDQQKREFAALQMAYIETVKNNDKSEQITKMNLIYYWLKKQINAELFSLRESLGTKPIERLSDNATMEFGLLQIAFISALAMEDREPAIEVEIKMIKWIDDQLKAALEVAVRSSAKMRIVEKADPTTLSKN
jgi:hypothetical protein